MFARRLAIVLALASLSCAQTDAHRREALAETGSPLAAGAPAWSLNATIIEACSCPMFCQCYFASKPASHPGCCPPGTDPSEAPMYCRFDNAFRVNHGAYGDTKLDGARFWISGDLGDDFSDGEMNWARLHFDPSVTAAQREGIVAAMGALYPVRWTSFEIGEDYAIDWKAGKDRSVARLAGGSKGEVVLARNKGMTDDPIVIHNLRYWGAPRNDGFVLMQNEIVAYRAGSAPFEFRGTNGFMITVDISSRDVKGGGSY